MHVFVPNRDRVWEALATVADRVAALIRDLPDTSAGVPRSSWTVGDVAAHVAIASQGFSRLAAGAPFVYGDGTAASLAEANAEALQRSPERDGRALAEVIVDATASLAGGLASAPAGTVVQAPVGPMDLDTLGSYALLHLLQHGCHIASALGRPMPVEGEHFELVLPFLAYIMPKVVDTDATRGLDACFEIKLRRGRSFCVTFDGGEATVTAEPPRRVDCHLLADPSTFFLVAMGVASHWNGIAKGKLLTWGRKPWLALRFVTFFEVP
jgi:uncharacterized protein (TIGR03083 family)